MNRTDKQLDMLLKALGERASSDSPVAAIKDPENRRRIRDELKRELLVMFKMESRDLLSTEPAAAISDAEFVKQLKEEFKSRA